MGQVTIMGAGGTLCGGDQVSEDDIPCEYNFTTEFADFTSRMSEMAIRDPVKFVAAFRDDA
jgi:hypothetical protein